MNPFEDMRLFCQVMESGSFTAAAEQGGLSKQFVSRRLIQLEDRLGVRLLSEVEQVEQGIAGQKDGRLVTLLEDFTPEALALSAVFPQHRQSSRPVQALIEFLRKQPI